MTVVTPSITEARFRVMGTDAHIIVVDGPADACATIERELRALERRWTRFDPASELMQLNARPGRPVIVSPDTAMAIDYAVRAWEHTGGTFDPTVFDALIAEGYDRDFLIMGGQAVHSAPSPGATPGCGAIHLDPATHAVTLPPGVQLDLGGIGKGLAADLTTRQALEVGATGACVNLGGDLCALGQPPSDLGWVVDLTLPTDDALGGPTGLAIRAGAVATSSTASRRWTRGTTSTHHLIDPATGRSSTGSIRLATVLAEDAWWAEVCAKSIIIAGDPALAVDHGNAGLIVRTDDSVETFGDLDRYLLSPDTYRSAS